MNRFTGLLVIGAAALAASPPLRTIPGISVTGAMGFTLAARDTLPYTLRWGKATNATSYKVTVTAVASPSGIGTGVTTGLPVAVTVPDTIIVFQAVNLSYDSIVFTATVTAYRGTTASKLSSTKSWTVAKLPGNPGPIIVDSSAIPPVAFNGLEIQTGVGDHNFPWAPQAPTEQRVGNGSGMGACAYMLFSDGTVAMRSQDARYCLYNYRTGYAANRRGACTPQTPQWTTGGALVRGDFACAPLRNAVVQAWADTHCIGYASTNPLAVKMDTTYAQARNGNPVAALACPTGGVELVAIYPAARAAIVASVAGISTTKNVGWSQ